MFEVWDDGGGERVGCCGFVGKNGCWRIRGVIKIRVRVRVFIAQC